MSKNRWVVVLGDLEGGLTNVHGPFDKKEEADYYAEHNDYAPGLTFLLEKPDD